MKHKIEAIKAIRDLIGSAQLTTDPSTGEIEIVLPSLLFCKHLVEQIMLLGAAENSLDSAQFLEHTGSTVTRQTRTQLNRPNFVIVPYPTPEPVEQR